MTIILQRNSEGLYVSELILDKYQILESSSKAGYYIWNHERQECHVEKNGSIDYYPSIEAALNYLNDVPKPKKEKKIKTYLKRVAINRKETALSLMRVLIENGELDDEGIAQKLLDSYPNSTYNKHMVKFQRKKMKES